MHLGVAFLRSAGKYDDDTNLLGCETIYCI